MNTVPCRGCGRPIVWGITPEGKRIPLDPRPVIYRVTAGNGDGDGVLVTPVERGAAMVIHFATCKAADQFSGKNRKPASPEGMRR